MIDLTPSPIAFAIGPLTVHWYGIAYAVGLAAAYFVIAHEARWRGLDVRLLPNAMIVVAIAALIGGRLYHVIDQWQLYKDDPLKIVLPPYSGLGVYGGIIAGTIAAVLYARWKHQPFLRWADAVAPGLFVMQAVARWGNFFNQELYGAPTNLPWGIAIECQYRTQGYACPPGSDPTATLGQHFQPMFLYESLSGLLGCHRPDLARPTLRGPTPTGRPAPRLLHLVRQRPVRRRVAQGRQLALLRRADCPDRGGHHGPRFGGHPRCPSRSIDAIPASARPTGILPYDTNPWFPWWFQSKPFYHKAPHWSAAPQAGRRPKSRGSRPARSGREWASPTPPEPRPATGHPERPSIGARPDPAIPRGDPQGNQAAVEGPPPTRPGVTAEQGPI